MDLNQRFNILAQGATIAQKKGLLSLDDAVNCKTLIDKISRGEELKNSLNSLANLCINSQSSGAYTLSDAHLLYLAIDGLDEEIDNFISTNGQSAGNQENVEQVPEQVPESAAPEVATVDYEVHEETTQQESPVEVPAEEPVQKKPATRRGRKKKE